jgi:hypothetical protein
MAFAVRITSQVSDVVNTRVVDSISIYVPGQLETYEEESHR